MNIMNKTKTKEKEIYEAPVALDIKPVSVVSVKGSSDEDWTDDPDEFSGLNDG